MVRFLIVDDDEACRELIKAVMQPYGRCNVAEDGLEAVEMFRNALDEGQPYDVIFLDIMMPHMDGHETLDNIRAIQQNYNIHGSDGVKIIITSALRDSKHCIRAFEEGCESYLVKPFWPQQLIDHVQSVIGTLPLLDTSASSKSTGKAPSAKTTPPTDEAGAASHYRFLIVDDDVICRELLKSILSPYGHCTFAFDGQEAYDAVRLSLEDNTPFDLVTLDIMMPGTDGHEALQKIRDYEYSCGIQGSDGVRVIMTTALRNSKHCLQAFREGCECYVTKPIKASELLKKMKELGLTVEAPV